MRSAIAMCARNGSLGGGGPSLLWACWPPWLAPGAPRRLAGRLERDRGIHADWPVVLPGALAVGLVVLAGAAVYAVRAT